MGPSTWTRASTTTLLVLFALTRPLANAETTTAPPTNATTEDRQFMDKEDNVALARMGMNTLTTACGGACGPGVACVVVGGTSANTIDCSTDPRCVTLKSGQTAWCMLSFDESSPVLTLSPSRSNGTIGAGPFDRIGQLQVAPSVTDVAIRRPSISLDTLSTPLDVSSFALQTDNVLTSVAIDGIEVVGADDALTLNKVQHISITNCKLPTIPAQFTMGNLVQSLDLSGNEITTADNMKSVIYPSLQVLNLQNNRLRSMNVTVTSFPFIKELLLDRNNLSTIPDFVFGLPTLTTLNLSGNPIDASRISETQFTFLAKLDRFIVDGVLNTTACPNPTVVARLSGHFNFCEITSDVNSSSLNGSTDGSVGHSNVGDGVDEGNVTVVPAKTQTSTNKLTEVAAIIGIVAVVAFTAWAVYKCAKSLCCPSPVGPPAGDISEPLVGDSAESGTPPVTMHGQSPRPEVRVPVNPQGREARGQGASSLIYDSDDDSFKTRGPYIL